MFWFMSALGLVILLLAGDALVKGAVNLSIRLGIPALIDSLTLVAFGTSAPELLIAINATLDGAPGIALGNVVGSNTANILLVLGIPAILSTLHTKDCDTVRNYVYMMIASVVFIALAFTGEFGVWQGIILLAMLAYVLINAARDAMAQRGCSTAVDEMDDLEGMDPTMPTWKIAMYLVLGLIGLPLGADILVDSATVIERTYGVSETVIGLTLVAIGTSLPELATTVMAAIRRQADVALGNVIGSNMFNLLAIVGVTSLIGTIPVAASFLSFDLWIMLGASALLFPFVVLRWNITRLWGVVLTASYIAYVLVVIS